MSENSGNRTRSIPRRRYLEAVGPGAFGVLAGCSESGSPEGTATETETETASPTPTPHLREEYGATTPKQKEAVRFFQKKNPDYLGHVREYLSDPEINEDLKDRQVELVMNALPHWREAILATEALFQDDWTRNGVPHVYPDGTKGPDYDSPFTLNTAPDAFVERYFNSTGMVHDPRTGEYLGFQPEETFGPGPRGELLHYGDKVGLKGDKNGNGSVANYIEGVEPEDLNPDEMHTVMAYHVMERGPDQFPAEDGGNPNAPPERTFELISEMFREEIPESVFREVMENNDRPGDLDIPPEVNFYTADLGTFPFENLSTEDEVNAIYRDKNPVELRGPLTYTLYVYSLADVCSCGGFSLVAESNWRETPNVGEAGVTTHGGSSPPTAADITLEETYWHAVAEHPENDITDREPDKAPSVSAHKTTEIDFLDEEWDDVLEGMNVANREYYQTPRNERYGIHLKNY